MLADVEGPGTLRHVWMTFTPGPPEAMRALLLEVFYTPGVDSICRQVQRQLQRNELARFYHHRTRKCIPPRKLRREIQ